ncbi:hypothetical protein J6G99_02670 [bacterium]|nr:hypothetical protein [bacterium]
MFNSVNRNPFNQKIESAVSTGQENKRQQQNDQEQEKRHLDDNDKDEVQITSRPVLSEDDIMYLTNEYISKLKSEYSDNDKILAKLNKFLSKFDVKKFMKNNPNMTASEFNMIMYNETSNLIK